MLRSRLPARNEMATLSRALLGVVVGSIVGCETPTRDIKIDNAILPKASTVESVPEGTRVVLPGTIGVVPTGGTLLIAGDRHTPWNQVASLMKRAETAGTTARLLVNHHLKLRVLELGQAPSGDDYFKLEVRANGKVCAHPPYGSFAKCVEGVQVKGVAPSWVRKLIREFIDAYGSHPVLLTAEPDATLQAVVRAADGARTCCKDKKIPVLLDR